MRAAMTMKCNEGHDGSDRGNYGACKGTSSGLGVWKALTERSLSVICKFVGKEIVPRIL